MLKEAGSNSNIDSQYDGNKLLDESKSIDDIDNKLVAMWETYIRRAIFDNPVSLAKFFQEYTAVYGYFYVIVNRHKLKTDIEVSNKISEIYQEYGKTSVTERDGVIRRSERAMRAKSDYYLAQVSWAKGCVNEMQTMLRSYGDETKMMGGNV